MTGTSLPAAKAALTGTEAVKTALSAKAIKAAKPAKAAIVTTEAAKGSSRHVVGRRRGIGAE